MMSWSLNRPGEVRADTIAWVQVVNADLPTGIDAREFLEHRLTEHGLRDAVGLMTARDVRCHHTASVTRDGATVETVVTLGLSNGMTFDADRRVADVGLKKAVGTINLVVAASIPLCATAMLEAISIASVARTAALLEGDGQIVATGTDCIIVACPDVNGGATFVGLHTALGKLIAEAVFEVTWQAKRLWAAQV
jgi:adenosylcobinamide amidohydrolase